jgi:nicotinate-nucleotide adenylyltransferase
VTTPEIIVYGGTFDPPHLGHYSCVLLALNQFPLADVLIVPAAEPAGAKGKHKKTELNFNERLELCKLSFGPLLDEYPRLSISDIEVSLPHPNYTINTLKKLREQNPERSLAILMGQDQLESFPHWHQPEEILSIASLVIVKRGFNGGRVSPNLNESLDSFLNIMKIKSHRKEPHCHIELQDFHQNIFLIDEDIPTAASETIRKHLREGIPLPNDWMSKEEENFLQRNHYYQQKGTTR